MDWWLDRTPPTIYNFDESGIYTTQSFANPSPLEPGIWLLPARATFIPAPECPEHQQAVWSDTVWIVEDIPEPEEPTPTIPNLATSKLTELSTACNSAIINGVDVETSQGVEHFSLTTEDQINLQNLMFQVASGAVNVPYHADGEVCRAFTAEEISAVSFSAVAHKTYHTTYYNYLKVWVNRTDNPDELNSIYYGAELPQDLAESMTALISSVGGVIG